MESKENKLNELRQPSVSSSPPVIHKPYIIDIFVFFGRCWWSDVSSLDENLDIGRDTRFFDRLV